jgi:broad specificity phosphatase PhoE
MLADIQFTLSLIRHGQSEINIKPDIMGQRADVQLTDVGRRQARALHNKFVLDGNYFDKIYSSDYTRALNTAQIVRGESSQEIILAEPLREYDAGDWTNASRKETLNDQMKLRMGYLHHGFLPPSGESMTQVERRASRWLEETILYNKEMAELSAWKKENEHPPLNIACFSHGMTIKCLLHYVMGFERNFTWKVTIDNTSVSKLSFGKEGWRLISINDCSHLLVKS